MGACSSTPVVLPTYIPPPPFPDYTGAGILFVEGPVVLAGIQKYHRVAKGGNAVLSGLGGGKEAADADWLDTAWREVVEELFAVEIVPTALLQALRSHIPLPIPPRMTCTSGYVLLHLGFPHLTQALALCAAHGIQSPLYKKMPLSIVDLMLLRCASAQAEIGPLALLPVAHRVVIASEFAGDLSLYRTTVTAG